jgi:hypothetical protein
MIVRKIRSKACMGAGGLSGALAFTFAPAAPAKAMIGKIDALMRSWPTLHRNADGGRRHVEKANAGNHHG